MSVGGTVLYNLAGRKAASLGKSGCKVLLHPPCDHRAEGASNLCHKVCAVVDISNIAAIAVLHGEELCEVTGGAAIVKNMITCSDQIHATLDTFLTLLSR